VVVEGERRPYHLSVRAKRRSICDERGGAERESQHCVSLSPVCEGEEAVHLPPGGVQELVQQVVGDAQRGGQRLGGAVAQAGHLGRERGEGERREEERGREEGVVSPRRERERRD